MVEKSLVDDADWSDGEGHEVAAAALNEHAEAGHWPTDELNLGMDNGDPVLTDPKNSDQVVLRYDRDAGQWVADSISTDETHSGNDDADARLWTVGTDFFASDTDGAIDSGSDFLSVWASLMSNVTDGDLVRMATGTYPYSGLPEIPDKAITVKGSSVTHDSLSYNLYGTIFEQQQAGSSVLRCKAVDREFSMESVGLTHGSSVANSDTGHGLDLLPPDSGNGNKELGVNGGELKDIYIKGQDGDHYAINAVNVILSDFTHIRFHGGGGIRFANNADQRHNGNVTLRGLHGNMNNAGDAHGIFFDSVNQQTNIYTFKYPSIRRNDPDAGDFITYSINDTGTDTNVRRISMMDYNLEGSNADAVAELPEGRYVEARPLMIGNNVDITGMPHAMDRWDQGNSIVGGSLDTWFQNTTGFDMFLEVTLNNDGTSITSTLELAPPTASPSGQGDGNTLVEHDSQQSRAQISAQIPNGDYYRLNSFGDETVRKWWESVRN